MSEPRKLRVFLCHSSNDKPAVGEFYQLLKAEGWIDPWLDDEKLLPGQDWDLEIEKAVEASDAVIVFLSNKSVTKEGYVQRELRFVLRIADFKPDGTVFVIPVRLDDCPMPRRLSMWQFVNYYPKSNRDSSYTRVLKSLKARAVKLNIFTVDLGGESDVLKKEEVELINELKNEKGGVVTVEKEQKKSVSGSVKGRKKELPTDNLIDGPQVSQTTQERLTIGIFKFVRVPAGEFIMGSRDNDQLAYEIMKNGKSDFPQKYPKDEWPRHIINIPYDYWISIFTVTNEQYAIYVSAKNLKHPVLDWEEKPNHPVTGVSWQQAISYSKWYLKLFRNDISHDIPSNYIFRLPTEGEWEKAARGTDGREWPWGNVFDNKKCNALNNYSSLQGEIDKLNKRDTAQVGKFSPQGDSPYGCSDMAGNVYEWTLSIYKNYPYDFADGREDMNATGARVVRGGWYSSTAERVRTASRETHNDKFQISISKINSKRTPEDPNKGNVLTGFRLLLGPPNFGE